LSDSHLLRPVYAAQQPISTRYVTTHGFENAQLMYFSGAQNVSYPEPGVQGGRPEILKDKCRSAPKAQINIKYMFDNRSGKNSKHDSLAEWSKALASGASP
jgi:hypothetical protein